MITPPGQTLGLKPLPPQQCSQMDIGFSITITNLINYVNNNYKNDNIFNNNNTIRTAAAKSLPPQHWALMEIKFSGGLLRS